MTLRLRDSQDNGMIAAEDVKHIRIEISRKGMDELEAGQTILIDRHCFSTEDSKVLITAYCADPLNAPTLE